MSIFNPTWLYIKQHNETGLKYFGKTTTDDPIKYLGSGIYWTRHLKNHGDNVSTIWCKLFEDKDSLVEYALDFSIKNNIVESAEWVNLKNEDGLMGGNHNRFTPEGRAVLSEKSKKYRHTEESKNKIREARLKQGSPMLGRKHSLETQLKISEAIIKLKESNRGTT